MTYIDYEDCPTCGHQMVMYGTCANCEERKVQSSEDPPSRAELEAEAAMDDEQREEAFRSWCREKGLDPEDTESMILYEEEFE